MRLDIQPDGFDQLELEEIANDEINKIEGSKAFQRLAEKTQVLVPETGRDEIVKTRFSHSYEVASSAKKMAITIAKQLGLNSVLDVDYQNALTQSCLLHDVGHPPFGHDGATFIDKIFKSHGLEEGFSDNNNNLVLIENQNLGLRDYVVASTIKYPDKLYKQQKEDYTDKLLKALEEDRQHFAKLGINLKNQTQTITCQIMDEADRNSYTCSDLTDFYCLGNSVELEDLEPFIDFSSSKQLLLAKQMVNAVQSGSKTQIKNFFLDVKNQFNQNWKLTDNGLDYIDKDLYELPPEEVKAIPTVCGSLREAMESLDKDREFLTQGGVFTDDQIDAYIALKFEEIHKFEHAPHPVEFEMYYSS